MGWLSLASFSWRASVTISLIVLSVSRAYCFSLRKRARSRSIVVFLTERPIGIGFRYLPIYI